MTRFKARRAALVLIFLFVTATALQAETADSVRKRLAAASESIGNLKGTMVVHPANRSDAKEINKGILEFLDQGFKEASIAYIRPDKFRAEGKARGIDVTYVLNGNTKQIIAPALMLKKTDDLSDDRAKKQSTLDLGFASDSLWRDNKVRLVSSARNRIKLRLVPNGIRDKRYELVTLDAKSLKVLTRERYKGDGKLKSRNVYLNHKTLGKMPVATMVKVYSSDGGYAGYVEYKNVRANTTVSTALFAIK